MNVYKVKTVNKNLNYKTSIIAAENLRECFDKIFLGNKSNSENSSIIDLTITLQKEENVKNEFEDESSRIEEKFIKEKDYRHCILCGNLMAPIDDGINICWDCRIKINEKMGERYGRD